MTYESIIAAKSYAPEFNGITDVELAGHLFPHQSDLVRWALRRGRAAIFASTGLGKGPMAIEWTRHVSQLGRVLIIAPLAVGPQLAREAARFGVSAEYARKDTGAKVVIANYEMLSHFDASQFIGVVCDESSILKSFNGRTRTQLIETFARTPYKLCCTATPAPNDFTELGNHSEFLGLKSRVEMLAEFFVHDGGSTQDWRLKGHAVVPFWRWLATWGAVVNLPSDLGHDDGAFKLPELRMHEHALPPMAHSPADTGMLFAVDASGLQEQRAVRRATMKARVELAAQLADDGEPCIVWAELNDEADEAERLIPGSVQVAGSDSVEDKESRLLGFAEGEFRVLVSKPALAGFGMNFQCCAKQIFLGASNSYEQTFQAIRRSWRFGQTRPVDVHVIRASTEGVIVENYRRKEADAARMAVEMTAQVGEVVKAEVRGLGREFNLYEPAARINLPHWL